MPQSQQSSDVVEQYSERAFLAIGGGLVPLIAGIVVLAFNTTGVWLPLGILLLLIGIGLTGYGAAQAFKTRQVDAKPMECPFCGYKNLLTTAPASDVSCRGCHRMIPIQDGRVLPVQQVRCGFCNALNYYSDKTEVLVCEECAHEIPIARADGAASSRRLGAGVAVMEDTHHYELTLVAFSHAKSEQLISELQKLLALNRNQVKQMLETLPVVLLTGIPRRKAEMVSKELHAVDGQCSYRQID